MPVIQSTHNEQLKRLGKLLKQAKIRRQYAKAAMEGVHVLQAYLAAGGVPEQVFVTETHSRHAEVVPLLQRLPADVVYVVAGDALSKLSALNDADDIISVIDIPDAGELPLLGNGLVLDGVQDPGNVGTIIRSAAAVGLDWLIVSSASCDVWSPKVLRGGMGGHFSLAIYADVDVLAWAKRFTGCLWLTALHRDSDSLYDVDLTHDGAWVVGNEGQGIADELLALVGKSVFIPMAAHSESLNVAMAASVCLFEQQRQRLAAQKA